MTSGSCRNALPVVKQYQNALKIVIKCLIRSHCLDERKWIYKKQEIRENKMKRERGRDLKAEKLSRYEKNFIKCLCTEKAHKVAFTCASANSIKLK